MYLNIEELRNMYESNRKEYKLSDDTETLSFDDYKHENYTFNLKLCKKDLEYSIYFSIEENNKLIFNGLLDFGDFSLLNKYKEYKKVLADDGIRFIHNYKDLIKKNY